MPGGWPGSALAWTGARRLAWGRVGMDWCLAVGLGARWRGLVLGGWPPGCVGASSVPGGSGVFVGAERGLVVGQEVLAGVGRAHGWPGGENSLSRRGFFYRLLAAMQGEKAARVESSKRVSLPTEKAAR